MDLKTELLAVLDNPSSVWNAIVGGLPTETRTALLVLTTCEVPLSIVTWQEAVARISADAAVRFEIALRRLDDTFVLTSRKRHGYFVDYRNPSMQDFCVEHLDSNVGLAVRVATQEPSLGQIQRLIDLGTAAPIVRSRGKRYPNIHEALVARPDLLLNRLLDLMSERPDLSERDGQICSLILTLAGTARKLGDSRTAILRASIVPLLLTANFNEHVSFLYIELWITPFRRVRYH